MGVAVYPRLGELLRASDLTMEGLERAIEQRYGLSVDLLALRRLALPEPVRQADLEVAGAVAAVLGVGLGDLFRVDATPVDDRVRALAADPDDGRGRRLAELLDLRDERDLTASEQAEVEALVDEWSRRLHELRIGEIAERWGLSREETRRRVDAQLAEAHEWWRAFEADPERQRAVATRARRLDPTAPE
jgi:hypothetical protein